MVLAVCPECEYRLAELVKREVKDNEVLQHFECSECDHEWSDTML
jgi:DNA-directed RNA polymerase subunit M/transcription elongation factor TFIIS